MNSGPADTHLDLADLIAEVTGQPISDQAREHLATCEHCRLEANRWSLVADGVRDLAAAAPQATEPARPRRTGPRVLAGPWRRAMLVAGSAAAALVLLVGIGAVTGYVHISGSGHSTGTTLTAVTGCTQLEQATGTLAQVNGTSLVIKTASGQPVTVTTAASTFVTLSGPLLSDITDGATVDVRGSSPDGTIAAAIVTVGPPFSAVNPPGLVAVRGTVADASTAGFTLVTAGGTRVPVTTSGDTLVIVPHASLGQLPAGVTVFAVGQAGPDGTLSARAVAAIRQLPAGGHLNVSFRTCSPSSIAAALALGG
jgi:predicted anti-sigma-YlaC factor YlaD